MSSDVPFHHPEEMQLIIAKVNDVVSREESFPIKLHAQRVASDTAVTDMANNFKEITGLLEGDIADIEKVDKPSAESMREVVEVLKDTFTQFHNHVLQRDSATAKDFEEYSESKYVEALAAKTEQL